MTEIFRKSKWIVFVVFSALAVFVGFFSISYAKWDGNKPVALSANAGTGSWGGCSAEEINKIVDEIGEKDSPTTKTVLYRNLPDQAEYDRLNNEGKKPQLGGVIAENGTVKAALWTNTKNADGYDVWVHFDEGDKFLLSAFNITIDPTNTDKNGNKIADTTNGYFVESSEAFDNVTYGSERGYFQAQKTGWYHIEVKENDEWKVWPISKKDNQYVVTIQYSAEKPEGVS